MSFRPFFIVIATTMRVDLILFAYYIHSCIGKAATKWAQHLHSRMQRFLIKGGICTDVSPPVIFV